MVLSILFGLLLNNSFRSGEKRVLAAISLVSLLALFLSGAKTMWVALILTLFIFAFLKRSLKVLIGTGCLVLLVAGAALISGQVRNMSSSILKAMDAHSMQIRYIGWKQSYQMFMDNPLLGVGPKCFMDARDKYHIISEFGQAHNMVLHVACEMGIVGVGGLISWIVFYIYFLATYRKKVRNPIYRGLWFGGVGYLVTLAIGGITEPTIGGEHSQLFMTLVGLMHAGIESNGKDCGKIHFPKELV
jgi:O-antigen ligase